MSRFKIIVLVLGIVLAGFCIVVPAWEDNVTVPPHGDMLEETTRQDFLGYSPMWSPPALSMPMHEIRIAWLTVGAEIISVVLLIAIGFVLEPKDEHGHPY